MNNYKAIKKDRLPFSWCAGCGINLTVMQMAKYFETHGHDNTNTSIISGIGCSGRTAGYFNMDTMHTTHGRAVAVAEGLKIGNPKLNVVVVSGDGDLLGIGLNHTLHTARRNTNIKVICFNNNIYGMTGGQASPTTPKGKKTLTTPNGNTYNPVTPFEIVSKPFKVFFARVTPMHKDLFHEALKQAFDHEGYSFIEVVYPCFENDFRRDGYKNASESLYSVCNQFKQTESKDDLKPYELGIVKY